ncbi:MAG: TraB/GumN family protein [Kofleriaceae bacterium]
MIGPAPVQSVADRPFLWEVRGPKGSVVLYATYHAAGEGDVAPAAWAALDGSQVFVAEAAEVPEGTRFDAEMFLLPQGESLARMISPDDLAELEWRLDLPREQVVRLKPWVAMIALAARAYPFPSHNISRALVERARERGMSTELLEDWAQQAHFLELSVTPAKLAGTTRVDDYLQGGRRAFVAIGVTHLLGPYGLVARLESEGYQVRRL